MHMLDKIEFRPAFDFEFEFWLDGITDYGVSCHRALKHPHRPITEKRCLHFVCILSDSLNTYRKLGHALKLELSSNLARSDC